MFGKRLRRELLLYLKKLWPFIITVEVMFGLALLFVFLDRNPEEATGSMAALGLFVMVAIGYVILIFLHAYSAIDRVLWTEKQGSPRDTMVLLVVQLVAFLIVLAASGLMFLADFTAIMWNAVGDLFASFGENWYYFLDFVFYFVVVASTVFTVTATWVAQARLDKQNKKARLRAKILGAITLLFCLGSIVPETLLLVHDTSTDMPGVWAFTITALAMFVLVDIYMYIVTRRTVNAAFSKPTEEKDSIDESKND